MKENSIELFCGIQNRKDLYSDNKTLVCLYSVFTLFFVIIVALLDYYKTHNAVLLMFPGLFLFFDFVFVVWLLKNKQNTSYKSYFLFRGVVTLAISFIWLFLAISNTILKQLGFSVFFACGVFLGIAFSSVFFILRFFKWQSYKSGKEKKYNKVFNEKVVAISIILILICSTFLKKIEKIILYKLLVGALIILFFIFITIALNTFVNYHIIKKYYEQSEHK